MVSFSRRWASGRRVGAEGQTRANKLTTSQAALAFALQASMAVLDAPWTLTPDQILEHFGVDVGTGLSADRASKHADIYGRNGQCYNYPAATHHHLMVRPCSTELPDAPPTPLWHLIIEQFKDQLVLILLGSAVISFVLALFEDAEDSTLLGAFVEPTVILLILIANAAVGVVQETNAEKAIDVSNKSPNGIQD